MLLVVFGAGASYDSVPHIDPEAYLPARPPLAYQLFDERTKFVEAMSRFERCKDIIPALRNATGEQSIEQVLAKFQREAPEYRKRYAQLAAIQFYLHFALWTCENEWRHLHKGITNYRWLLDKLAHWQQKSKEKVIFVTFNYDTIFEESFSLFCGLRFVNFDCYLKERVFKLHGSVSWAREVKTPLRRDIAYGDMYLQVIDGADHLEISDRFRFVTEYPMSTLNEVALYPALAIPVENKNSFECPSSHVESLKELLPQVTKILTIGWRAKETHFLKMLGVTASNPPHLFTVSGSPNASKETHINMLGGGVKFSKALYGSGGFTHFLRGSFLEDFLKS